MSSAASSPKPPAVERGQLWRQKYKEARPRAVLEVVDHMTFKGTERCAKFGEHKYVPVRSLLTRPRWVFDGVAEGPLRDATPVAPPRVAFRMRVTT